MFKDVASDIAWGVWRIIVGVVVFVLTLVLFVYLLGKTGVTE